MIESIRQLFSSAPFMPHGHCFLWRPDILWVRVLSDSVIAIAYYSIPIALIYFVKKRQDLAFNWIFMMFAVFILACGTTHIMDIWTTWVPIYRLEVLVKVITAAASLITAALLWPLIPKLLKLPNRRQLEFANAQLLQSEE